MKILRNILAIIAGFAAGSIVNMSLLMLGNTIVELPPGTDVSTPEGLAAAMPRFTAIHYLFPFLAHALGTLAGAWVAASIALTHKMIFALVMGGLFLIGGIANAFMLPAPAWFIVLDLMGAYIPMAWIGGRSAAPRGGFSSGDRTP